MTVTPSRPIHVAGDRTRTHRTDHLVVVERKLQVVGMVTGHDLLRTVSRQTNLLLAAVDERITALDLTMVRADVDPSGRRVRVRHGGVAQRHDIGVHGWA